MATRHRDDENDDALATAIGRYALGEISLGKAAADVGVSRWEMRDILEENGVQLRLGPEDTADAAEEVENIRDFE